MQRTLKEQLKRGLSTLPTPKNDYEIVVPEEEMDTESGLPGDGGTTGTYISVEDQADIDARIEAERKKQSITPRHSFYLIIIIVALINYKFYVLCRRS